MKVIAKYWWIIVLVAVIGIVLYFYFEWEKSNTIVKLPSGCPKGVKEELQKLEDHIDATADWKNDIEDKIKEAGHHLYNLTYEQARRKEALYYMANSRKSITWDCAKKLEL